MDLKIIEKHYQFYGELYGRKFLCELNSHWEHGEDNIVKEWYKVNPRKDTDIESGYYSTMDKKFEGKVLYEIWTWLEDSY